MCVCVAGGKNTHTTHHLSNRSKWKMYVFAETQRTVWAISTKSKRKWQFLFSNNRVIDTFSKNSNGNMYWPELGDPVRNWTRSSLNNPTDSLTGLDANDWTSVTQ